IISLFLSNVKRASQLSWLASLQEYKVSGTDLLTVFHTVFGQKFIQTYAEFLGDSMHIFANLGFIGRNISFGTFRLQKNDIVLLQFAAVHIIPFHQAAFADAEFISNLHKIHIRRNYKVFHSAVGMILDQYLLQQIAVLQLLNFLLLRCIGCLLVTYLNSFSLAVSR